MTGEGPGGAATRPQDGGFVPRPIDVRGAAAQIAEQLRAAIKDGSWKPGERLPTEHQLAATYGVSRGTVREAMRLLSAANLVETTRGASGGSFVAVPQPEALAAQVGDAILLWFQAGNVTLAEVDQAREIVERQCVRLAAGHRTDEDLEAMEQAVEGGRNEDLDEFLAADLDFHIAVSRAAKNAILELAMTAIHLVRPRTNTILISALEREPVYRQHRAMFEAIRDRDPDAADAAFGAHFHYLSDVQREALHGGDAAAVALAEIPTEDHPDTEVLARHETTRRVTP